METERTRGTLLGLACGDAPDELVEALRVVSSASARTHLQTTGYVVHTLQTVLHDAVTADSAEEAIVTAVNRGGDTDTVGAVTGAVAGARFGHDSLPDQATAGERAAQREELIERLACTGGRKS